MITHLVKNKSETELEVRSQSGAAYRIAPGDSRALELKKIIIPPGKRVRFEVEPVE